MKFRKDKKGLEEQIHAHESEIVEPVIAKSGGEGQPSPLIDEEVTIEADCYFLDKTEGFCLALCHDIREFGCGIKCSDFRKSYREILLYGNRECYEG